MFSIGRGPEKPSDEKPYCINLWAPPGFGKSSTRAAIFNHMKSLYKPIEEVHEFAKFLTYEGNELARTCPFYMTASQEYAQYILKGKVKYIVTDSPVGTSLQWANGRDYPVLVEMVRHLRGRYRNLDYRLTWKPGSIFETYGRNQTEASSKALEATLEKALRDLGIGAVHVEALSSGTIVHHVLHQGD